eukprot:CAMPEP_0198303822 /NCGR_PEP_ID=MMETSP1449-20131203/57084_1 /TAXON_ID=420275 /ORGANISM="Attheya septentrionalis, Strain CCMP2084" /LENGTH=557 /DNA_ID=CAMNT_0044006329 /DNA_START=175 /DNA_END=1848 /DNA_ORIENTATION=-
MMVRRNTPPLPPKAGGKNLQRVGIFRTNTNRPNDKQRKGKNIPPHHVFRRQQESISSVQGITDDELWTKFKAEVVRQGVTTKFEVELVLHRVIDEHYKAKRAHIDGNITGGAAGGGPRLLIRNEKKADIYLSSQNYHSFMDDAKKVIEQNDRTWNNAEFGSAGEDLLQRECYAPVKHYSPPPKSLAHQLRQLKQGRGGSLKTLLVGDANTSLDPPASTPTSSPRSSPKKINKTNYVEPPKPEANGVEPLSPEELPWGGKGATIMCKPTEDDRIDESEKSKRKGFDEQIKEDDDTKEGLIVGSSMEPSSKDVSEQNDVPSQTPLLIEEQEKAQINLECISKPTDITVKAEDLLDLLSKNPHLLDTNGTTPRNQKRGRGSWRSLMGAKEEVNVSHPPSFPGTPPSNVSPNTRPNKKTLAGGDSEESQSSEFQTSTIKATKSPEELPWGGKGIVISKDPHLLDTNGTTPRNQKWGTGSWRSLMGVNEEVSVSNPPFSLGTAPSSVSSNTQPNKKTLAGGDSEESQSSEFQTSTIKATKSPAELPWGGKGIVISYKEKVSK